MAKNSKPERKELTLPDRLLHGLDEVDIFIRRQLWQDAQELLKDLDRRFPDQPEVLAPLAHVCIKQKNWADFLYASERLAQLDPEDPELKLALAGAYMNVGYPASALIVLRSFVGSWPRHEETEKAQRKVTELENELNRQYLLDKEQSPAGDQREQSFNEWLKLTREKEDVEILVGQARFPQAISRGEAALRRNPDLLPLLNTLCIVYWMHGQDEKALALAQRAADLYPKDASALGNVAKILLLSGNIKTAQEYAQRLKDIYSSSYANAAEAIKIFAYLGAHTDLREVFEWLQKEFNLEPYGYSAGFLYHLAGVAEAHLGNFKTAQDYWEKSQELIPDFEPVRDNLADLEKEPGKRNGAYAYLLNQWLSPRASKDLNREMQSIPEGNKVSLERAMRRWVSRHSEVIALSSFIMQLGSETGREFLLSLAEMTRIPELIEVMKEFALGRYGNDEIRLAAANLATSNGNLPIGIYRLWLNNQWTDTLLMGIKIVPAAPLTHTHKVDKWLRAALASARDGQYLQAENLLRQAIEIEPEAPDLLFNLAAALQNQRCFSESEALLKKIVSLSPGYVLACASLAQLYISQKQLERARPLLETMRLQKQMTQTEFDAFCAAHMDQFLAEKNNNAATIWFGVWQSADPNNPKLELYKSLIQNQ